MSLLGSLMPIKCAADEVVFQSGDVGTEMSFMTIGVAFAFTAAWTGRAPSARRGPRPKGERLQAAPARPLDLCAGAALARDRHRRGARVGGLDGRPRVEEQRGHLEVAARARVAGAPAARLPPGFSRTKNQGWDVRGAQYGPWSPNHGFRASKMVAEGVKMRAKC